MPAPDDERSFGHVPGLDGVRGIAVLLVVVFHYGKLWRTDTGGILPSGFIGVDIFFVLSGFLITSLLLTERAERGAVSFPKFYVRRGLRLLPALCGVLAGHFVYSQARGVPLRSELEQIASVLAYVSNFAQIYWQPEMLSSGLSFTWTLAVEEQFYLLWPAALLFGILKLGRTRPQILALVLGLAAASALVRLYIWHVGEGYPAAYMRFDARADGLLVGAAAAFLWRWRWVPTKYLNEVAIVAFTGIIGTALVLPRQNTWMYSGGFTVVAVAAAVVILATAERAWALQPWMEARWLRTLGRVSYGVYLWHALSLRIVAAVFEGRGRVAVGLLGLALTAVATTVSWYAVEQPFLRLKTKWGRPGPPEQWPAVAESAAPGDATPDPERSRSSSR